MTLNTGRYLQIYAFITLVVCGLIQYFTGVLAILWLPVVLALAMTALLLMQNRPEPLVLDVKELLILIVYLLFLMLATISTLLQGGVTVTIVGFKNEVAMSLVMFCLLLGFCRESQIYRVIKGLYGVFWLQFPVVIYQLIVVVPQRVALRGEDEKWDSVVGTFGGDPMGGGNTAILGLFCLLIMLLKVSELKHGLTTVRSVALYIVLGFALCVVGEVKFVILLSPFLLALVWCMPGYVRGVKQVNFKTLLLILLAMVGLIAIAIMALAASYSSAFGADSGKSSLSVFWDSLDYIFDTHYIMPGTGELGRLTTLFFWGENSDRWGLSSVLFGYGLNSTNSGSAVSPGFLNLIFRLVLDSTSLSMLLWEVGIVGTLMFVGIIIYIVCIIWPKPQLSRSLLDRDDIRLLSYAPAFNAFIIGCLLSLPYSQMLMIIPMLQFLFYLVIGSALVIRRTVHRYSELRHE